MAKPSRREAIKWGAIPVAIIATIAIANSFGGKSPQSPTPSTGSSATPEGSPSAPPQKGAGCTPATLDLAVAALHDALTSTEYGYDVRFPVDASVNGKHGKGYTVYASQPGLAYDAVTTGGKGHRVTVTDQGQSKTICLSPFSVLSQNSGDPVGGYNTSPTASTINHLVGAAAAFGSINTPNTIAFSVGPGSVLDAFYPPVVAA